MCWTDEGVNSVIVDFQHISTTSTWYQVPGTGNNRGQVTIGIQSLYFCSIFAVLL